MIEVRVGEFSRSPFGRKLEDGKFSGERFRKEKIAPSLRKGEKVWVYLDDVVPGYEYGSSFLHEAFGGLVLYEGFTEQELKARLKIVTEMKDVEQEIWEYIQAPAKYL
ncbi:STAS-like domain-containing protein [Seongchinamella unica]|nr:STAS-like domain-containing protein [Seongchinamella unica]